MQCASIEERLSEYVERTLPHEEIVQVAEHLQECPHCLGLMEEIRAILVTCRSFPTYEVDSALFDRILLRTSGRPRTRPFKERFKAYFLRPALTPRFAIGVGLALLFTALMVDLMLPRVNLLASVLSPQGLFLQMDRGMQQIYSEGLKLYNAKNEWQTQITHTADNVLKKLRSQIEQLDVPVEGKKKSDEQKQPEKNPGQNGQKSSVWLVSHSRGAVNLEGGNS
jgi:hypothetical protein